MIASFKDKFTAAVWAGRLPNGFPAERVLRLARGRGARGQSDGLSLTLRGKPLMAVARADADLIDFSDVATGERLVPVTPGDVLRAEFMSPLGLSARTLARELDVPPNRITGILNGERAVTAKTALLLA